MVAASYHRPMRVVAPRSILSTSRESVPLCRTQAAGEKRGFEQLQAPRLERHGQVIEKPDFSGELPSLTMPLRMLNDLHYVRCVLSGIYLLRGDPKVSVGASAESRRVAPEGRFKRLWWTQAWKIHRSAFPPVHCVAKSPFSLL